MTSVLSEQVLQDITRRASITQVMASISKKLSVDADAENTTTTSTSLPPRRNFLNPSEDPEAQLSAEKVETSPKTKRRKLRRSNTEIEMTQAAKLSHYLHKLIPGAQQTSAPKGKKDLEKMWQQTYIGMCNRAVVLNHAILKAEREEATVKPVSLLDIQAKLCVGKKSLRQT